jgi:alcohol dehydrogenase
MLTYTYISKGKFGLVEKPKPTIKGERDAIVKVTLASICSSDLHIKHGSVPRAVEGYTDEKSVYFSIGFECFPLYK